MTPPYVITPLQGITDRAGEDASPSRPGGSHPGRRRSAAACWRPDGDGAGADGRLDYFAGRRPRRGRRCAPRRCARRRPLWIGEPAPGVPGRRLLGPPDRGVHPRRVRSRGRCRSSGVGTARLFLDGEPLADTTDAASGAGLLGLLHRAGRVRGRRSPPAPPTRWSPSSTPHPRTGPIALAGLTVEARPPAQPDAVERAVRGRGRRRRRRRRGRPGRPRDRGPGRHDDGPARPTRSTLVRQVAAANPRTVVVVNTASPVTMDWADDVAAVVQMSYLGQETGAALAAVLFGDADASGRLTTTYPRAARGQPRARQLPRRRTARSTTPRASSSATATTTPTGSSRAGASATACRTRRSPTRRSPSRRTRPTAATRRVRGVGRRHEHGRARRQRGRPGVRAARSTRAVARPDRELKGFEKVTLDPGETTTVTVALDERAFAYWDTPRHAWHVPPGAYEILVGSSSRAIHQTADAGRCAGRADAGRAADQRKRSTYGAKRARRSSTSRPTSAAR